MRKLVILTIASLALAGAATAAGAAAHSQSKAAAPVKVSTRKVAGLGTILVNSKGLTLYMFVPDKQKKVTCVKACAVLWPPLKAVKGEKLVAAGGAKKALLSTDRNPSGGLVVTYAKWPLYTYLADRKPGTATGQAVNSDGGLWYVLSPSGKVIKTKLHH